MRSVDSLRYLNHNAALTSPQNPTSASPCFGLLASRRLERMRGARYGYFGRHGAGLALLYVDFEDQTHRT